MIVTIDGPAGSGKSTAARALAQRLGFEFLDTGAMYRAVTLACLEQGLDVQADDDVARLSDRLAIDWDGERIWLDGRDVSDAIRSTAVTLGTRFVASNVAVRRRLVQLQQQAACGRNIITEGRDQGTEVFPHAECKIYLTADPRERAVRRHADLAARGEHVGVEELLAQQTDRDRRDQSRLMGALKPAPDAVTVDTTGRSFEEVLQQLADLVRSRREQA